MVQILKTMGVALAMVFGVANASGSGGITEVSRV